MVDSKDIDILSSELENRLDDLFDENEIRLPDAQEKNLKEHYPLAELKNLILSIDWEITDEVIENLLQQLKDLQLTYKNDKIVMMFLQILNSLGNFIKTHRAKAHPKTFKILNSVFSSLDKVVLNKDMAEPARKNILRAEMNRYNELRAQIAKNKTAAVKHRAKAKYVIAESPTAEDKKEVSAPTTKDEPSESLADAVNKELPVTHLEQDIAVATLAEAVKEIKRYIHSEIKALKEQIQSLREQK